MAINSFVHIQRVNLGQSSLRGQMDQDKKNSYIDKGQMGRAGQTSWKSTQCIQTQKNLLVSFLQIARFWI